MRKYAFLILAATLGLMAKEGFTYRNGAPSGRSGSLGDNSNTCASPYCHSGPTVSDEVLAVSVNVAIAGYSLGDTLDVAVEMTKIGGQRFGFELAAEEEFGQKVGRFLPVSGETKLVGGNITHVSASTDAMDSNTWMFKWIAPYTAEGAVTFYVAGNFANSNNNASGDVIAISENTIQQATMSVSENRELDIQVFPNPASSYININGTFANATVSVYNLSGALLIFERVSNNNIDIAHLPAGAYIVKVEAEGKVAKQMISIAR
ncbi:MAG: hypothetical protein ACI8ZO_000448 [Flavobacteriales bacterium]|jgi:hypothetical protein